MPDTTVTCTGCNYKFAPKTGKVPARCPYCDKVGTLQKAKQMQDWLDEVDSDKEE